MAYFNTLNLLAAKLRLNEDEKVLSKAAEFLRLLNTKSVAGSNMTDTSKIVICLDLAAALFNLDLDNKTAVKYSGLKTLAYVNCKKIVENLLDLNNDKKLSISSLCLTLQCSKVEKLAEQILEEYRRCSRTVIDLSLPQYVCMAVYQACRLNKIKVSKTKIMEKARLKPSQWAKLDVDWSKFAAAKFSENKKKTKEIESADKDDDKEMIVDIPCVKEEKCPEPKIESYEIWKKRILEEAYREIKELERKENEREANIGISKMTSPRRSPRKTPQKFSPYNKQKSPRKPNGIRLLFPSS